MTSYDYYSFLASLPFWRNRWKYAELMDKFIHGKLKANTFNDTFFEMWSADRDTEYNWSESELLDQLSKEELEELEKFKTLQKSDSYLHSTKLGIFGNLMDQLFTAGDVFEPDPTVRNAYEISEEEFRDCVKKTFAQIQQYL